ncbi:unnamed protein product [Arabidopsis halleri]
METEKSKPLPSSGFPQRSREGSRNYYTPMDNFTAPKHHQSTPRSPVYSQEATYVPKRKYDQERVRSFPQHIDKALNRSYHNPRNSPTRSTDHHSRTSSRDQISSRLHRGRHRYPPQALQWKEKAPPLVQLCQENRWLVNPTGAASPTRTIPTKEQVMGELREVTVQYVSCADPTDSAARKHRVIQGEANNLMSTTADQIIEAAVASTPESYHHLLSYPELNLISRLSHSEDSPPPALEKGKGVKRGKGRPPLAKSTSKPPIKLTGVKSQKRNLIQGSPKKNTGQKQPPRQGSS